MKSRDTARGLAGRDRRAGSMLQALRPRGTGPARGLPVAGAPAVSSLGAAEAVRPFLKGFGFESPLFYFTLAPEQKSSGAGDSNPPEKPESASFK